MCHAKKRIEGHFKTCVTYQFVATLPDMRSGYGTFKFPVATVEISFDRYVRKWADRQREIVVRSGDAFHCNIEREIVCTLYLSKHSGRFLKRREYRRYHPPDFLRHGFRLQVSGDVSISPVAAQAHGACRKSWAVQ